MALFICHHKIKGSLTYGYFLLHDFLLFPIFSSFNSPVISIKLYIVGCNFLPVQFCRIWKKKHSNYNKYYCCIKKSLDGSAGGGMTGLLTYLILTWNGVWIWFEWHFHEVRRFQSENKRHQEKGVKTVMLSVLAQSSLWSLQLQMFELFVGKA